MWRAPALLLAVLLCVVSAGARSAAADPELAFPVLCQPGVDCFLQIYVDTDPRPASAADYGCGTLANDGFVGTSIRVKNERAMKSGVTVVAAAAGRVIALQDGIEDISRREAGDPPTRDLARGNLIAIDHGDGWVTEYDHLKNGSIAVKRGQEVKSGDKIGEVGLSGRVDVPMLTFLVRHYDDPIDPFTGKQPGRGCGPTGAALWTQAAAKTAAYAVSGKLDSGFALDRPRMSPMERGDYADTVFQRDSAMLIFWARVCGLQPDDILVLNLFAPNGDLISVNNVRFDHVMADASGYTGRKRPPSGWAPGVYRGTYRLLRDSLDVLSGSSEIVLP